MVDAAAAEHRRADEVDSAEEVMIEEVSIAVILQEVGIAGGIEGDPGDTRHTKLKVNVCKRACRYLKARNR